MPMQLRWTCHACNREWAYAHHWNGEQCPACGSPAIERVRFSGLFDIHTPQEETVRGMDVELAEAPKPTGIERIAEKPPLALMKNAIEECEELIRKIDERRAELREESEIAGIFE
jgi:hypothetical protein